MAPRTKSVSKREESRSADKDNGRYKDNLFTSELKKYTCSKHSFPYVNCFSPLLSATGSRLLLKGGFVASWEGGLMRDGDGRWSEEEEEE